MSNVDLSNKAVYDMLNDNVKQEKQQMQQMQQMQKMPQPEAPSVPVAMPMEMQMQMQYVPAKQTEGPKKMVRSLKGFVMFALIVILVAAFIYFTVYRLGWGVQECMKKNYHDCAALLTPEIAPLAATGLLALL